MKVRTNWGSQKPAVERSSISRSLSSYKGSFAKNINFALDKIKDGFRKDR
jgi:hypothetical protein